MTENSLRSKSWINIAKICSAVGVVLQHVRGYVYSGDYIYYSVWWAVALFVMIGGYNSYSSWQRRGSFQLKNKIWRIVSPYFVATLFYSIYNNHFLDGWDYLDNLFHFNASGPFYFVAVYIQLLTISPILIAVMEKCLTKKWLLAIFTIAVITIGWFTTLYTNLFDIAFGGGNLFAGPWLIFWFAGMCIKFGEKFIIVEQKTKKWIVIGLTIAIATWQYYFVNRELNLEWQSVFNGEQVGLTWANALETILIFFWFKYTVELFESTSGSLCAMMLRIPNLLGRHTLYIFLYHMIFLYIYREHLQIDVPTIDRWLCLIFVIIGPVLLGQVLSQCKLGLRCLLKSVRVE